MFYDFPVINTLDDVLEAIEGSSEFIVADRGDHTVVNYVVMTPDTFPPVVTVNDAIRRECRGMIFSKDGKIIRRPFNKFFNINQVAETQADQIDLSQDHVILSKLDGSMIVPYRVDNTVIFGTKMGNTDVATHAQRFVEDNPKYMRLFEQCEQDGQSPIFEFMSRKQRIVIDHPVDQLVLTAVRYLVSGQYLSDKEMRDLGARFNIDVVEEFAVDNHTDINNILEFIRAQEGTEGVVIRFANGHQCKAKSEWYVAIHGAKEAITEEKNVVQLIIDQNIDDTKSLVLQEDRDNLDRYERQFWEKLLKYSDNLGQLVSSNIYVFQDRKTYALDASKEDDDYLRVATFHFFDRGHKGFTVGEVQQFVLDRFIRPNLSTRTKFGAMKNRVFPNISLYL